MAASDYGAMPRTSGISRAITKKKVTFWTQQSWLIKTKQKEISNIKMENANVEQLAKKKCVPCEGGVPKLSRSESEKLLRNLPVWKLNSDATSIRSEYAMKDFQAAIDFINKISEIANEEDHHPDLHLTGYRKLVIELNTHAIGGLSENDFILAAKIDRLPRQLKK